MRPSRTQSEPCRLKGGWQATGCQLEDAVTSCGSVTVFLPIRPASLGCCLRARTVRHRSVRGLCADLQRPQGKRTRSDLSPTPHPHPRLSLTQHLGRLVLPRKSAHGKNTYEGGGDFLRSLFPAAKNCTIYCNVQSILGGVGRSVQYTMPVHLLVLCILFLFVAKA